MVLNTTVIINFPMALFTFVCAICLSLLNTFYLQGLIPTQMETDNKSVSDRADDMLEVDLQSICFYTLQILLTIIHINFSLKYVQLIFSSVQISNCNSILSTVENVLEKVDSLYIILEEIGRYKHHTLI